MTTSTIGELSATAEVKNVYRRNNGETFIKLNEQFHVQTCLSNDGKTWVGDGTAEVLDPDEKVELIQ